MYNGGDSRKGLEGLQGQRGDTTETQKITTTMEYYTLWYNVNPQNTNTEVIPVPVLKK